MKNQKMELKKELEQLGGSCFRGVDDTNADLDLYVPKKNLKKIIKYLDQKGFFSESYAGQKITLFKVVDKKILQIDLEADLNYVFKYFRTLKFKKNFIKQYINNPNKYQKHFSILRYIFLFKKGNKHIKFLENNKEAIFEKGFFKKHLNKDPFRKRKSKSIISKNILIRLVTLRIKFIFEFVLKTTSLLLQQIKRSTSVAIIGPDGAGKTTVIRLVSQCINSKEIYMGERQFLLQPIYNQLNKVKLGRFFVVFFMYTENWLRLVKASYHKLQGKHILFDRHPSYAYFNHTNKISYHLNNILYRYLFPKPKKVICLTASTKEILKRKKEMTKKEIENTYKEYYDKLESKAVYIKNTELNKSVRNTINSITNMKQSRRVIRE